MSLPICRYFSSYPTWTVVAPSAHLTHVAGLKKAWCSGTFHSTHSYGFGWLSPSFDSGQQLPQWTLGCVHGDHNFHVMLFVRFESWKERKIVINNLKIHTPSLSAPFLCMCLRHWKDHAVCMNVSDRQDGFPEPIRAPHPWLKSIFQKYAGSCSNLNWLVQTHAMAMQRIYSDSTFHSLMDGWMALPFLINQIMALKYYLLAHVKIICLNDTCCHVECARTHIFNLRWSAETPIYHWHPIVISHPG